MIEAQALENPGRVAFRFREKRAVAEKTVSESLDDINALGTYAFDKGIKGAHVALVASNSYQWLVIYFAMISGGNVVVPIDRALPAEEIAQLIERSECEFAFAADDLAERLKSESVCKEVFPFSSLGQMISRGGELIASGERSYLDYKQDTNALSMIVYTSGTTAKSKGVMLTQANILADVNKGCRNFKPEGVSMSVLPYHHMFGLVVALIMLVNWRTTVFINTSLKYLTADLKEAKPHTAMFVPLHLQTFYNMIMERAKSEGKYKKLKSGMRLSMALYKIGIDVRRKLMREVREAFGGQLEYILVGGAALDPFYEREYRAWGIDLITAYGATECSPGIAASRNHYHRDGSVGLPIGCLEVKIADDGEVLIRGDNVMTGYWKDEKATSEALIDGWYHSGDLGYLDRDGFLYLTGRKKNLIILSDGENVSPEKLESRLGLIEGVSEALVYQENDAITAEIFPTEKFMGDKQWFDGKIAEFNNSLPPAQRIKKVVLRVVEFPKNTSRKILRHEVLKEKNLI